MQTEKNGNKLIISGFINQFTYLYLLCKRARQTCYFVSHLCLVSTSYSHRMILYMITELSYLLPEVLAIIVSFTVICLYAFYDIFILFFRVLYSYYTLHFTCSFSGTVTITCSVLRVLLRSTFHSLTFVMLS